MQRVEVGIDRVGALEVEHRWHYFLVQAPLDLGGGADDPELPVRAVLDPEQHGDSGQRVAQRVRGVERGWKPPRSAFGRFG